MGNFCQKNDLTTSLRARRKEVIDIESLLPSHQTISRAVQNTTNSKISDLKPKILNFYKLGGTLAIDYGRRHYKDFISITIHIMDQHWLDNLMSNFLVFF